MSAGVRAALVAFARSPAVGDRLAPIAERAVAEQPGTPREVDLGLVLPTYLPLFLLFAPLVVPLAIVAFVGMGAALILVGYAALMILVLAAVVLVQAVRVRDVLRADVVADARIVRQRTGYRGSVRVTWHVALGARAAESESAWLVSRRPRAGEWMRVLVDPETLRVGLVLGDGRAPAAA